jgi:hypothetical protein
MTRNWWQRIASWRGPSDDSYGDNVAGAHTSSDALSRDSVRQMVDGILSTKTDEIGCDECFERMGIFAELTLAGMKAEEAMPLVQDHLQRCADCREEYEALLVAMQVSD